MSACRLPYVGLVSGDEGSRSRSPGAASERQCSIVACSSGWRWTAYSSRRRSCRRSPGGSLVVGLILCQNGHRWPGSEEFFEAVVPSVRARLTTATLQWSYAWRSVVTLPWRLARGRAHVLAGQLEAQWGICGSMRDAPETPRWMVNATCYETGRNWRFSQRRMGDYVTNYVLKPATPIADAIAASAAVPGVIGPLAIRSEDYDWHRYEKGQPVAGSTPAKRYALWDGGVYDNLGVEALFKPGGGFPRRLRLPGGERCISAAVSGRWEGRANAHALAAGASSRSTWQRSRRGGCGPGRWSLSSSDPRKRACM